MSIYAPKYPNMSIHDLYERALGCYDEIVVDTTAGDLSDETEDMVTEFVRLRQEIRLGLAAAGLEV